MKRKLALVALLASSVMGLAHANYVEAGIAQYREMLQDGNPAELFEMAGEELWTTPRGPKNATMEKCDIGKGTGVVAAAFVELPRYFADTGRVQDLESRIVTCMVTLQGFDEDKILKTGYAKGEQANVRDMATYVSGASRELKINVPQDHQKEREMYEVGKRLFFMRSGPHDFACATCHAEDNKRIRLQGLPNITGNPGDGIGFAAWPAYRVGNGQMWPMQKRLNDCYRQQRFPEPKFASDATIALGVYIGVNANDAKSIAPAIKR